MPKPLFRVKRYSHKKYKFVVRGKVAGAWKRKYFATAKEAQGYARVQNSMHGRAGYVENGSPPNLDVAKGNPSSKRNGARGRRNQQAVVVLGMHRSGTSAFAGGLARLGVDFGDRLAGPAPDNEKGFWEHPDIVGLHDQLLAGLGLSWDDDAVLPPGWTKRKEAIDIQRSLAGIVARDFGDKALFGFKDPRLSRLLPLWLPILERLEIKSHFVLMVRHPWEVAESLKKRNGINQSQSQLLWLRHTIEAERSTRGFSRSIVSYARLIADPGAVFAPIMELLNRPPRSSASIERAVAGFVHKSLRHHLVDETNGDSAVKTPALEIYHALLDSTTNREASNRLAELTDEVGRFSALFQPRIEDLSKTAAGLRQEIEEKTSALLTEQREGEAKAAAIALLQGEVETKTKQIFHFKGDAEERAKHIAILQRENEEKTKQVVHFQRDFEERGRHIAILKEENAEKTGQVLHFQRHAEEQAKHIGILQQANDEKTGQVTHFQGEAVEKAQRLAELQQQSGEREQRLAELQRQSEEKAQRLAELQQQREEKAQCLAELQQQSEERERQLAQARLEEEAKSRQLAEALAKSERATEALERLAEESKRSLAEAERIRLELQTVRADKEKAVAETERLQEKIASEMERLRSQVEQAREQLSNKSNELVEVRWEMLTQRADVLRRGQAVEAPAEQVIELQDRLEAATGDRDQLRGMIMALQNDVEQERLNVLALLTELRWTDRRASEMEEKSAPGRRENEAVRNRLEATEEKLRAAHDKLKTLQAKIYAGDDRLAQAEEKVGRTEARLAAALDQLRATQTQLKATQEHLIATARESLEGRKQLGILRERVSRRLILPFGKSQRELQKLTRQS